MLQYGNVFKISQNVYIKTQEIKSLARTNDKKNSKKNSICVLLPSMGLKVVLKMSRSMKPWRKTQFVFRCSVGWAYDVSKGVCVALKLDQCNLPLRPIKWSRQVDRNHEKELTSAICPNGHRSGQSKLIKWNSKSNC